MNNNKIKRTNVFHSKPQGDELKYGELFLNYNYKEPMLAFKTDDDELRMVETSSIKLPDDFLQSYAGYVDDASNLTSTGLALINEIWEKYSLGQADDDGLLLQETVPCHYFTVSINGISVLHNCVFHKVGFSGREYYNFYDEYPVEDGYDSHNGPFLTSIRWDADSGAVINSADFITLTSVNYMSIISGASNSNTGLMPANMYSYCSNLQQNFPILSVDFVANTPNSNLTYRINGTGATTLFPTEYVLTSSKRVRVFNFTGNTFNNIGFLNNTYLERVNALPITSGTNKDLRLFNGCTNLKYVDACHWDTCNITTMESWFQSCSSLKRLDLNGLDTRKVTNLSRTFQDSAIKKLNVELWYTPNLQTMASVFQGASALQGELDLSN